MFFTNRNKQFSNYMIDSLQNKLKINVYWFDRLIVEYVIWISIKNV